MKGEPVPVKERYTEYGKGWIKRYSDNGMMIERDGAQYSEAIDPSEFGRTYTETDIPVEAEATTETDLTVSDTLEMLSEMGVDTDD